MKILLIGFILSSIPQHSIAIFHFDGKTVARRIGQDVGSLGKISGIQSRAVLISNKNGDILLYPGDDNGQEEDTPQVLYDEDEPVIEPADPPEETSDPLEDIDHTLIHW